MVHDRMDFHNCAELLTVARHDGLLLQRVPEEVRSALNPNAQERVRNPDCVEIRFVTSGDRIAITLSAVGGPVRMLPMWGDFPAADPISIGPEPTTFELAYPERLSQLPKTARGSSRFDPSVWRLQFTGRGGNLYYHTIDGDGLAPPPAEFGPSRTLLAYGTSITHGAAATLAHLSYAYQTARLLGADLINLGVGGACHAEAAFADHIADRGDWHVGVLALSVNMIGAGFGLDEFRDRTGYMIERVAGADRARRIFCVTIYPHFRDLIPGARMEPDRATTDEFRAILEENAAARGGPNTVLLKGPEILADPAGLTADLVHPSDYGMTMMARNLADAIGSPTA